MILCLSFCYSYCSLTCTDLDMPIMQPWKGGSWDCRTPKAKCSGRSCIWQSAERSLPRRGLQILCVISACGKISPSNNEFDRLLNGLSIGNNTKKDNILYIISYMLSKRSLFFVCKNYFPWKLKLEFAKIFCSIAKILAKDYVNTIIFNTLYRMFGNMFRRKDGHDI